MDMGGFLNLKWGTFLEPTEKKKLLFGAIATQVLPALACDACFEVGMIM
jgi:hypothetical protein